MPRSMVWSLTVVAALTAAQAWATERRFTFTYESGVLPPGGKEIELWATPRLGRAEPFAQWDYRAEYETGLTDRLQTSLYLNVSSITVGVEHLERLEASLSNEWKYKLLDPVADVFGFSLYGEITASPRFFELETKLILDKRVGNLLAAVNLVQAVEWEREGDAVVREVELEQSLGVAYLLPGGFALGVEGRHHAILSSDAGFEGSALSAGPVLSYAAKAWWGAVSYMPQVAAVLPSHYEGTGRLELSHHESFNARVLVGFHL